MDCSLNSHSGRGYVPNAYVQKYSDTNPVGLQFLTSTRGFNRRQLGGSLAQALDAGVALGAHWIEIYSVDAGNPANEDLLKATAARLKR
jgi:hypothetical protein